MSGGLCTQQQYYLSSSPQSVFTWEPGQVADTTSWSVLRPGGSLAHHALERVGAAVPLLVFSVVFPVFAAVVT